MDAVLASMILLAEQLQAIYLHVRKSEKLENSKYGSSAYP
jgi:hypothetical protein